MKPHIKKLHGLYVCRIVMGLHTFYGTGVTPLEAQQKSQNLKNERLKD